MSWNYCKECFDLHDKVSGECKYCECSNVIAGLKITDEAIDSLITKYSKLRNTRAETACDSSTGSMYVRGKFRVINVNELSDKLDEAEEIMREALTLTDNPHVFGRIEAYLKSL